MAFNLEGLDGMDIGPCTDFERMAAKRVVEAAEVMAKWGNSK